MVGGWWVVFLVWWVVGVVSCVRLVGGISGVVGGGCSVLSAVICTRSSWSYCREVGVTWSESVRQSMNYIKEDWVSWRM